MTTTPLTEPVTYDQTVLERRTLPNVVVLDDSDDIIDLLAVELSDQQWKVSTYTDPVAGMRGIAAHGADIVISDLRMPQLSGIDVLRKCKVLCPYAKVILLTGYAEIDAAVSAMKEGAHDFLTKPLDIGALIQIVRRILPIPRAECAENSMTRLAAEAEQAAKTKTTVLINGETGVGKEILADFIQSHSPRSRKPYVKVDCAALPESLIESELFGHEKGAYTGAGGRHIGRIERANGGTVLLDEIAELPLKLQAKLLRVLQSHEIERVGGDVPVSIDFRLICATHSDLRAKVRDGLFREDLYYRINVFPLFVPPLRNRPWDILRLAQKFLSHSATILGKNPIDISPQAQEILLRYSWPGNVRELQNIIERATIRTHTSVLEAGGLPWLTSAMDHSVENAQAPHDHEGNHPSGNHPSTASTSCLSSAVEAVEQQTILMTLEKNGWNYSKAAIELEVSRSTLYAKLQRYGIKTKAELTLLH